MKILIVYGTVEGQTRKIASFMKDIMEAAGHSVTIADASDEPAPPGGYDAVMIGSPIHIHKYHSAIAHYITRNVAALNNMPGAFFSVCLAVASDLEDEHREAQKTAADFLEQTGWKPIKTIQIAGALKYTEYDFLKRIIMKMIAKREHTATDTSKDYEYTDWNKVKSFVTQFLTEVSTTKKP